MHTHNGNKLNVTATITLCNYVKSIARTIQTEWSGDNKVLILESVVSVLSIKISHEVWNLGPLGERQVC
jgi:hypothetical protein